MQPFRRMAALFLAAVLITPCLPALAEGNLAFTNLPALIRPGKLVLISFTSPSDMELDIVLTEGDASEVLFDNYPAKAGENSFSWDGTVQDGLAAEGTYQLRLDGGDKSAQADVAIGLESPALSDAVPSDPHMVPGTYWYMLVNANMQGKLTIRLQEPDTLLYEGVIPAGPSEIPWDGTAGGQALAPGEYTLILQLTDDTGFTSTAQYVSIMMEEAGAAGDQTAVSFQVDDRPVAPADFSHTPSNGELNYWTLPMDITNEAAIWEVMLQPITVLDGNEKLAYKLRARPEDDAEPVGEVTYWSQGVRVLETLDNGWSLVESYSSSFHDSKVKVFGEMVQGYVKTNLLKTKSPSKKYGLVIDKLTQRMYIFKDGKLFSELLVSTGLVSDPDKLYTETQAGDYLLVSRVGKFMSDNLHCEMAIRFNNGNLIHQVPYTLRGDGSKYFDKTEPKLGTKASHGCIRVQRRKNSQGVNMTWLWNNLENNTRVLIWEDYKGRQVSIPGNDTPLYYNPEGGTYYHSDANCPDVKAKFLPLSGFTYGQLEDDTFASLTRCPACAPPMRKSELEAINAAYAK